MRCSFVLVELCAARCYLAANPPYLSMARLLRHWMSYVALPIKSPPSCAFIAL